MALTAALVVGGLAAAGSAGASIYGASQGAAAQRAGNKSQQAAIDANNRTNELTALQDAINSASNARQLALDNQRYDEAKAIEEKQRQLTNALATATQMDGQGNSMGYDALTKTWSPTYRGVGLVNHDRAIESNAANYNQQVEAATTGAMQGRARRNEGSALQSKERALSDALLSRYATGSGQGRTQQQMEGALVEKNVAEATDPLVTGGNMAMLAGYRQGNSGNDALMGSLARQSQGGTRSAIANARFAAPGEAYNDRDAAAKSILAPATTLAERGSSGPGVSAPTFAGDTSGNLMASLQRNNPAGVGSTLNPRNGAGLQVKAAQGSRVGFTPLNANGNQAAGISEGINSFLNSRAMQAYLNKSSTTNGFNEGGYGGTNAPAGYADRGLQSGDYPY